MNPFTSECDISKYIRVTYWVETDKNLAWASWQIACGQSLGNPNIRNQWETDELFENHAAKILGSKSDLELYNMGYIDILYPKSNWSSSRDGINHLLCIIQGGQVDIAGINKCRVVDIYWPKDRLFSGPSKGITGIRKYTKIYNKPLLLGIVKPKVITSTDMLKELASQLIEGGCNLIKEDEIMASPDCMPLSHRVKTISKLLQGTNIIYFHTINADSNLLEDKLEIVSTEGGNGVHINFWSGFGSYAHARTHGLFIHGQTSGMKILGDHNNKFGISWSVLCELMSKLGCDTIHTGMIGGYGNYGAWETLSTVRILQQNNTLPTLSCGFTPDLVKSVTDQVGIDYAVGAGGSIHGHKDGTKAGVQEFVRVIDAM
jgi:ribulose-bisphosphate carboxylase large chain